MTEEGDEEAAAPSSTNSSPMDHEEAPNDNVSGSNKYETDGDDAKNDTDDNDHCSSTRRPTSRPPHFHHRQIICQLDRAKGMFRVIKARGKALYTGGFGISMTTTDKTSTTDGIAGVVHTVAPSESTAKDHDSKLDNGVNAIAQTVVDRGDGAFKTDGPLDQCAPSPPASTPPLPPKKTTAEYLFIEEVVFLHERGILEAQADDDHCDDDGYKIKDDDDAADDSSSRRSQRVVLDTSQLFQLLPAMGVSLPVYLVYSHLCGQDFRVIRHDPKRLEILVEQQEQLAEQEQEQKEQREKLQQQQPSMETNISNETSISTTTETTTTATTAAATTTAKPMTHTSSRQKATTLRKRVRESIQTAPAPVIPQDGSSRNSSDTATTNDAIRICWDCYNPNSHFGKTKPGFPDFFVAITHYNIPLVKFSDLQALLQGSCQHSTTATEQAIVHIPLKVATVSDSGTVVMFGVTGYSIPDNDRGTKDDE